MTTPPLQAVLQPLRPDDDSAERLRAMKRLAGACLLVAAALFLLSLRLDGTAAGFLQAGAEAAMVGGLADWFAVTALFRHPLGLRIPHTALVPRKKDELATKLGEFVTGNFLTRQVVAEQVVEAGLVPALGRWIADPANSARLSTEAATAGATLLAAVDDDSVTAYVLELLRRDQDRRSYAPVLGRLLERAVQSQTQRPLVDLLAGRARDYLVRHREELRPVLREFVDRQGLLVSLFTTDRRVREALDAAVALLVQVEADKGHPLRRWVDGLLRDYAQDLQTNPLTASRVDLLTRRLLEDQQAVLGELVRDGLESVRESLRDPAGALPARIAALLADVGRRMSDDPDFRSRTEHTLQGAVGFLVDRYGGELTELIRRQVARWEADDASRRIELAVGRDLQFIRINGTAVGALAGLAIHALQVLLD
ncbi:MAG: hypothetical protein JWN57_1693 [Frankiales bacterium]|nr:hypothetical protein [Frankiales bacterium]